MYRKLFLTKGLLLKTLDLLPQILAVNYYSFLTFSHKHHPIDFLFQPPLIATDALALANERIANP